MTGSIGFDRAADYYDAIRGLSDEGVLQMTDALAAVFAGARRPVLEVGVGTGQIAVPLARRGVPVAGIDLSRAMLRKVLEKSRGGPSNRPTRAPPARSRCQRSRRTGSGSRRAYRRRNRGPPGTIHRSA